MNLSKRLLSCVLSAGIVASAFAVATPVYAEDALLISSTFEGGTDGWSTMGTTTISPSTLSHSGNGSLYVSGRAASWAGPCNIRTDVLKAGNTYNLSSYVMYNDASAADTQPISFMLKYTDSTNKAFYVPIATVTVNKGEWTKIENTAYKIPAEATSAMIYWETTGTMINYYVDDVTAYGPSTFNPNVTAATPLKNVFGKYFDIGCAATPSEVSLQVAKDLVKTHYNNLTIGNELKPDYVLDKAACQASGNNVNPQVKLDSARSLLKYCAENNIEVRGHVLVWHSQTPSWFFKENFSDTGATVSKDVMNQRLENYIKNLFAAINAEFPTLKIYAWDVVNECYLDGGNLRTAGFPETAGKEASAWNLVYGDDSYIDNAFTYARKYAPAGVKLFYNDFNEYIQSKRNAIYTMAMRLKSKGIIDGIGMQSHLDMGFPDTNTYKAALTKFGSTGLEVQVTELDITTSDTSATGLANQATKYAAIMQSILDAKKAGTANITNVVFWGITDGTSWRATRLPLLFDGNYYPKPAFDSVVKLVPTSDYYTPGYALGDVNNDGKINALDLALVKKGLLSEFTDPAAKVAADVNKDGNTNAIDLALLKKYLLGQITSF
ncbi:endo-1,4-beta-xylanase [Clostridium cellulovorans]|uniref:Beta-xylanase n=2 Tax=Clostridium cellulovorans TaxID=1493 RepID=D9SST3_CLOC7|nr:endo-1,4-beta-xylanase [Clostridium cellulovorans]AAT37531.1 xylanase B [Clostridium cellulovorans]ADL52595.1 glycoside hydrolase family 10 [Clostridium cellulovorans 743B]